MRHLQCRIEFTGVEVSEFNRVFPVKMDGTRTPGKVIVRKHTRQIGHKSK